MRNIKRTLAVLICLAILCTFVPMAVYAAETDTAKIMADAAALASGDKLAYEATLTGKVISVDEVYSTQYKNVTVTIEVSGYSSQPIKCYRMVGTGADEVDIGYVITVTGNITNYNGTIEFANNKNQGMKCELVEIVQRGAQAPEDPKVIVDQAFALAPGASLPYTATLTGKVVEISTEYSEPYKNITVRIKVEGSTGMKTIECYRMTGEGAETIKVGDMITVTGMIKRYCKEATEDRPAVDKIEFDSGCTFTFFNSGTVEPTEPQPTEPPEPTEPTYNTTRLYCQTPDDWDRCWVYWWGSSTVVDWPGMEMIRDITGLWFYDVPSDATNVIFNNYDYGYQSADLYIPTNDNRMYLYDDQMWVSVTAEPESQGPFYVAGCAALCGSEWDENDPANRMTRRDSATWEKIYYGVAPGDYQLKVTDGTWTNFWGGNGTEFGNYEFSVVSTCDVTVVFYPESHTVYVYGDYVVLPEVPVPSDPRQIVEDAFALEPGASLPYTATLTGKVTEIVSPYSPEYMNISVNIEAEAFDGTRIIECFRLNGEGVEYLTIGDTITVSGTIERYYREYPDGYTIDTIEFYYPEFLGYGGNTPPYPAVYRVVGNADWMGNWDPANDAGRMEPVFDGYEATFLNVQPGDYELKITKNGSWTDSWGENGMNYCFTVAQPCDVTVTFKLIDDIVGIISVSGNGVTNSGGLPDCQHSYTTTLIPPTCNSEGYALHVCTLCGRSFTGGHIPMLEHVISKYTYQNNATCTENATEYGICEVCGQWIYREVENTALGHSFTEYLYNLDATCSADGTETAMCDHCRQTDTRPAPGTALEHIFEEGSCIHCGETAGLPGDVTGDGKLNILDIARLYAAIKGSGTLEANADVSGDGKINIMDVVKLYAYVKGGSPLF